MAHATPWLVLAGSGGLADVLAVLVTQPHLVVPRVVEKQLREKFPGEHFSWDDVLHFTQLVGASGTPRPASWGVPALQGVTQHPGPQLQVVTAHQHLVTVYDSEQEGSDELDTVILKALVKGECERLQSGDAGTAGDAV